LLAKILCYNAIIFRILLKRGLKMETEKTAQKKTLDINLAIIFGITLMAVLGVSSITPVFPQMMRELNLTDKQVAL